MPTKIFEELEDEKKLRIINACICEFGEYGYDAGSTNRIVTAAGISKGSLFKYFENKEELFLYIADTVSDELDHVFSELKNALPKNLTCRLTALIKAELDWYINNPEKCRFVLNAFSKSSSEIYSKLEKRRSGKGQSVFLKLLSGADMSELKYDKKRTLNIIKWCVTGYNTEFMAKAAASGKDLGKLKKEYLKGFSEYMKIIDEMIK